MASNGSVMMHELQARIRELETSRKTRAEEASRIIASQRTTIDRLKADNQRLATDLASAGSVDAAAVAALVATGASTVLVKPTGLTPAQAERSDKLIEVADTFSRKIEVEQRQLETLEREVELAQAQVLSARRDMGGHSGAQAITMAPAKAIKALETRLDAAQRRYNEHIAANRDLKQQIDAATRRQAGMEQVRSQLEREVAGVAAELLAVQEAGRVAGEARQEAMAQVAALRVAEDAEAAAFDVEVRELAACQAADEKLLQAQAARLTKVVEDAEAAEAEAGPGGVCSSSEPLDLDSLEQGVGVEAAAVQLQRAAGLPSLPEALTHYSSLEQSSFDLFTACNEANERITAMAREARELEGEVRQLEAEAVAGRQHEAIRQVLGRRDSAVRRADSLTERRTAIERRTTMLRTGISTCLRKLGAAAAAQAWEATAASAAAGSPASAAAGSILASAAAAQQRDGGDGAAAASNGNSNGYGYGGGGGGGRPPSGSGISVAAAPPAHPSVAACAHVMSGMALLEQRAAAVIAVQGSLVGRPSASIARQGSGRPPSASLPSTSAPPRPPSSSASAAFVSSTAAPGALLAGGAAAAARAGSASGSVLSSGAGAAAAPPAAAAAVGRAGSAAAAAAAAVAAAAAARAEYEMIEDDSDDEEDEMPLTREQIQARSQASSAKM